MTKSNYDRWEASLSDRSVGRPVGYVAAARGASAKWVNRHGRTVEVLRAEDEQLDTDGMPWLACCTDHGNLIAVPTKSSGVSLCRDTTQFCDECRAEARRQAEAAT